MRAFVQCDCWAGLVAAMQRSRRSFCQGTRSTVQCSKSTLEDGDSYGSCPSPSLVSDSSFSLKVSPSFEKWFLSQSLL